jgi:hypothetical protein
MSDAVFFVTAGLVAAAAIALALVWPQGLGARSPAPFGHPVTPELASPPPAAKAPAIQPPPIPLPSGIAAAPSQTPALKGAL